MRQEQFDTELTKASAKLRNFCMGLCRRYQLDSDDLVQDTLLAALDCSDRYTPGTNMSAWLIQIALNFTKTELRRHKQSPFERWDLSRGELDDLPEYVCEMGHDHDVKMIHRAVKLLKGKQRELLFLKMKGYRNTEIAEITGTRIDVVKNHLWLGRKSIHTKLNAIYFGNNLKTKPQAMNLMPVKSNTGITKADEAPIRQGTPMPDKIAINLTDSEWRMLTTHVLGESEQAWKIQDKYMKALLYPLLRAVYIKLHNKLHSLKISKNTLTLTLPEASVLSSALLELNSDNYLIVSITGYIDQKLT